MRASTVRALLPDRLLAPLIGPHASSAAASPALRNLVDHLAVRGAFELSDADRDAVASSAAPILRASALRHAAGGWSEAALRVGARSDDPHVRGASAAALDAADAWEHAPTSDGDGPFVVPKAFRDGVRVSEALSSAVHARFVRGGREAEARLPEAEAALRHEQDGHRLYDAMLRPIERAFRTSMRALGRDRASSRLAALVHGRLRKGRALQAASGLGAGSFTLGAALGGTRPVPAPARDRKLAAVVGRLTSARRLREGIMGLAASDAGTLRALGEAGVSSTSAPARLAAPGAESVSDGALVVERLAATLPLGPDLLTALAALTLEEAVARLEAVISRPNVPADAAAALGALSSVLAEEATASPEAAFGDWARLPRQPILTAPLAAGSRVWRRAARRSPSLQTRTLGQHGRAIRPTALADDEGRLVGYAAFDALSDEFHGAPVSAVYAPDGSVFGHLPDGERHVRVGEPRHGFVTCPDRLALPGIFAKKEEAA